MDAATAAAAAAAKLAPLRGRHRLSLIIDLAAGEPTHKQLAEKYGRHISAIDQFSVRHHQEIKDTRPQINDQAGAEEIGLWILIKRNRWAGYQQHLDDLESIVLDPEATRQEKMKAIRESRALMRQIAEERGELIKSRLDAIGRKLVRHVIEGLDSCDDELDEFDLESARAPTGPDAG